MSEVPEWFRRKCAEIGKLVGHACVAEIFKQLGSFPYHTVAIEYYKHESFMSTDDIYVPTTPSGALSRPAERAIKEIADKYRLKYMEPAKIFGVYRTVFYQPKVSPEGFDELVEALKELESRFAEIERRYRTE